MLGEDDAAKRGYEFSLADYRAVGDTRGVAIVLGRLAFDALGRGDFDSARALAEESLEDEQALDLFEWSADLCRRTGFPWAHVGVLVRISDLLLQRGQIDEAGARLREALPLLRQMGDRPGTIRALARLAPLAGTRVPTRVAGRLERSRGRGDPPPTRRLGHDPRLLREEPACR